MMIVTRFWNVDRSWSSAPSDSEAIVGYAIVFDTAAAIWAASSKW